jgi:RimJ/RimL family protein N-acetyltransferase
MDLFPPCPYKQLSFTKPQFFVYNERREEGVFFGGKLLHIENENLTIRDAVPSDATSLCAWWNDGKVMAHAGFPMGLQTSPLEVTQQILKSNDQFRLLIIEADGNPIGEMNYRLTDPKTAEIGIKICDFGYQGKGYGPILIQMLLEHLFVQLSMKRVILDTNLNNTRAQHVYEKCGFKKIRVNPDAWMDQTGVRQTSVDYELTSNDFFKIERN